MKEVRTLLTESSFTNLCKNGFFNYTSPVRGSLSFTRNDIKNISMGEIVSKISDDCEFKFALQDIGFDVIREILKRSPIYSELSKEI